jgi:hypothetical protein
LNDLNHLNDLNDLNHLNDLNEKGIAETSGGKVSHAGSVRPQEAAQECKDARNASRSAIMKALNFTVSLTGISTRDRAVAEVFLHGGLR